MHEIGIRSRQDHALQDAILPQQRNSRRHLNGQDRSVEYAVLGRMAAEMEYELLDLIERAA